MKPPGIAGNVIGIGRIGFAAVRARRAGANHRNNASRFLGLHGQSMACFSPSIMKGFRSRAVPECFGYPAAEDGQRSAVSECLLGLGTSPSIDAFNLHDKRRCYRDGRKR
jgi:hypothetical protein